MPVTDQLAAQLDQLAAIEPGPFPFVSLYLNMQPNQHGRDDFEPFVRVEETLRALELGQVDELVITAVPDTIDAGEERAGEQLVAKARQMSAKIRFIEDASLLAAVGCVGALLRFKI